MKIRPVGGRFVPCARKEWRTDERPNVTKLIVAFHKFANEPKKSTERYAATYVTDES
jgi:hypothetical protein